jgi:hypothetical protein
MNNYDDITYKINGCAMKVHNILGNGFQEVIYQRCLAIELERAKLGFAREIEQDIFYDGIHVGTRNLEDVHLAQAKNYLVAYDKPIGLLINFGATSLQFKKVFHSKYRQNQDLQDEKSQHQDLRDLKMNRMKDEIKQSRKSQNPEHPDSDNNRSKS